MTIGSPFPAILFMYLGRFGALGRFTHELAAAAGDPQHANARFLISANNENARDLAAGFANVRTLATFDSATPAALTLGYLRSRKQLAAILEDVRPAAVVNLMPHVWSPLLSRTIKAKGCRFVPVIHDAVPHPGDPTARLTRWLLRDVRRADRIVTLSRAVAQSLAEQGFADTRNIVPLFHPDLTFGHSIETRRLRSGEPLRLLFFGRIMSYKGLDLLASAVAAARTRGVRVSLGVYGSGKISPDTRGLLNILDADVENRWIADSEINGIFSHFDAVVCSHTEASQSGVAATAFGHALPVIAFPTGGIAEQVIEGQTGVLAETQSPAALADAIARLASSPQLYETISQHLAATAPQRSMVQFLDRLSRAALA
jgi:glycosyltransferase involved in cell wall biosynthesis